MSPFLPAETLRQHRPLLLAMEAIGWFHMAGKARVEFLRGYGGEENKYNERMWHTFETPPFPSDSLLQWVRQQYGSKIPNDAWPGTFAAFTEEHAGQKPGLLGLLQAGHGIVSGIEKNVPTATSKYLNQTIAHMWLSSPWGHPKRNLLADPPEILSPDGWRHLVQEIRRVLEQLRDLGTRYEQDVASYREWRERAIGEDSYIRRAFLSTLAETRVPNNDVTLWDQSYVAAALFKSAVAGALLNCSFPWKDNRLKANTRWRLLTIGIGTEHYEARAVKIGDWTGAQGVIDQFFHQVAQLVEVDLAVGSLLYRDDSVAVFSFPGERFDEENQKKWNRKDFRFDEHNFASWLEGWTKWLQEQVDQIASNFDLETPPCVLLSSPTRSVVPMVEQWRKAKSTLAVPVPRSWNVPQQTTWENSSESRGHVCPVCRVRLNGDPTDKGIPCTVCRRRRHRRRDAWLQGQLGQDTIWFEEVADRNGRLALLTFSLDLLEWLNGDRVDSLRAQAIPEWATFNPILEEFWKRDESSRRRTSNPIKHTELSTRLTSEIIHRFREHSTHKWRFPETDLLLANLQDGFRHFRRSNPRAANEQQNDYEERLWRRFYEQIVEDRADAPEWATVNDDQRAAWFTHQLFRKLPSPGRVYRFWREAEEFFADLLCEFRQITARYDNSWCIRRVLLVPEEKQHSKKQRWKDRQVYTSTFRGTSLSLLFLKELDGFVTVSNLASVLQAASPRNCLQGQTLSLQEEDSKNANAVQIRISKVAELPSPYGHLNVYHPLIPLELSPHRFRVIVPLEAASECVARAVAWWRERFARVWDRLPLHVGVVGFPRMVPYQAVVEAARNLEDALTGTEETWRVEQVERAAGVVALGLRRGDGRHTMRVVPVTLPDGRADVFYPYVAVEDHQVRFPRDFQHPRGQVYRHVADLQVGDCFKVNPARVKTLFMDTTAARFDTTPPHYLEEWERMCGVWTLLQRVAPSQTALQRLRSQLARLEKDWQSPQGKLEAQTDLWHDTLRALLVHHLEIKGGTREELTEAAVHGNLQWALDWHMTALKQSV